MKKFKLTESELTKIITKIINEQSNLSYDEFLEEMLQRGQNLQKLVEVIRKGNPNEMASWDVRTQEKALGEFREVAEFTTDLINEFKVGVNESKQPITERKKPKRKVEDSKYTKWCKEHGWEHGVGQGCADDALDSKDIQMRSWAIGFILGMKEGKLPQKTIKEEDLGGMTSDPRIMAREYGNIPETPEAKAAEQIFKLFDHKIGAWTISPDHRVTQETQQYLNDWKEDVKSQLEVIINTVVSEYQEQDIDDELDSLP